MGIVGDQHDRDAALRSATDVLETMPPWMGGGEMRFFERAPSSRRSSSFARANVTGLPHYAAALSPRELARA